MPLVSLRYRAASRRSKSEGAGLDSTCRRRVRRHTCAASLERVRPGPAGGRIGLLDPSGCAFGCARGCAQLSDLRLFPIPAFRENTPRTATSKSGSAAYVQVGRLLEVRRHLAGFGSTRTNTESLHWRRRATRRTPVPLEPQRPLGSRTVTARARASIGSTRNSSNAAAAAPAIAHASSRRA